jgi:DNA-directed RNA polymerase beta subunit
MLMDCGGYFIIKGSEKTVLGQERAAENRVYCFRWKKYYKMDLDMLKLNLFLILNVFHQNKLK